MIRYQKPQISIISFPIILLAIDSLMPRIFDKDELFVTRTNMACYIFLENNAKLIYYSCERRYYSDLFYYMFIEA